MDFEDLGRVIDAIQEQYDRVCLKWENERSINEPVNQKNKCIRIVNENPAIMEEVLQYRAFVARESISVEAEIGAAVVNGSTIELRAKTKNSVTDKINSYTNGDKHEGGNVPIGKCLNDLLGIRIIIGQEFSFEDIKRYVDLRYAGKYKCIDSSKPGTPYKATHIYFKKNNTSFQWELQVWKLSDKKDNKDSHEIYKQSYTTWENEAEGGVDND